MQLLSIKLQLLPVISDGVTLKSAWMPALTLAVSMSAKYMRQVRTAVLEEWNKDYVQGARARGVRSRVILWKNVMKSSMLTDYYTTGTLNRKSAGGNCYYRKYFYVGWRWKTGSRCDYHA